MVFNTAKLYLTQSQPVADTVNGGYLWRASARNNQTSDEGAIKAYMVAIKVCPTGWSNCLDYVRRQHVATSQGSGYLTATGTVAYPWVVTSIGGWARPGSSQRRFLADLIPFNGSSPGFTVRSKSHGGTDTASMDGDNLQIMVGGAPWSFNAVAFNSAGRLLNASNTLQQAANMAFAANQKWSLERLFNGNYRLRNGDPGTGGACAYWPGGTSTSVLISSSCSGTQTEWSVVAGGSLTSTFQLRNVAANRCLDNNGQGGTTANVVLKTCGSSGPQQLFLDHFNWP